jgi:heme exporter protein D
MNTGSYGQQIIDTVREVHHFLEDGFGTFYYVALGVVAVMALLWLAREVPAWRLHRKTKRDARRQRERRARQRARGYSAT